MALALIGLAAFAALALDGGNLYTEQRRAQAAADNSVMAAAYAQMNGVTVNPDPNICRNTIQPSDCHLANAAFDNAAQNGYTAGPATKVVFHLPPIDGAYAGNSHYMEVVITQLVPTALAHLFYQQDPIPLTVIAVAHGSPTGPIMPGYALAAMKPDCSGTNGTMYIQGNGGGSSGGTNLTDGGVFVNATCANALNMTGNNDFIYTDGPHIDIAGTSYSGVDCTAPGVPNNCNFYPAPTTNATQAPQDPLANTPASTAPDCSQLPQRSVPNSNPAIVQPGQYTSLDAGQQHDMIMQPGIYCLTGGQLSGGKSITGTGVLIYLVDVGAKVNFSGNGILDLRAPVAGDGNGCSGLTDTSHDICKYLGILIYKTSGNNDCLNNQASDDIDFSGSASMNIIGLIYAPKSLMQYAGQGNLTMTGQAIVGCVKFNGNGNLNIIYNPNATYSPPPSVRLDQ